MVRFFKPPKQVPTGTRWHIATQILFLFYTLLQDHKCFYKLSKIEQAIKEWKVMQGLSTSARAQGENRLIKIGQVQGRCAAPHGKVALGENRSVCCKTAREKSSGTWKLFVPRESETGRWSCQGEKYSTVAVTCNHRKERFAFLRTAPLLLQTDRQPGRLQALPTEPGSPLFHLRLSDTIPAVRPFFQGQSSIAQCTYISLLCTSLCKRDEQHPSRKSLKQNLRGNRFE